MTKSTIVLQDPHYLAAVNGLYKFHVYIDNEGYPIHKSLEGLQSLYRLTNAPYVEFGIRDTECYPEAYTVSGVSTFLYRQKYILFFECIDPEIDSKIFKIGFYDFSTKCLRTLDMSKNDELYWAEEHPIALQDIEVQDKDREGETE